MHISPYTEYLQYIKKIYIKAFKSVFLFGIYFYRIRTTKTVKIKPIQ